MLVSADQDAPRGTTSASFSGSAQINGETVTRAGFLASMAWPVPDAWSQIPSPRLLADVPVSVCGSEQAPLTVGAEEDRVWEVTAGEQLTIPLRQTRRCEFSGAAVSMKTFGTGFDSAPAFDVPLDEETAEAVFDLAKLKTPPGDYTVAFYGSAVAKYRHNLASVVAAEAALDGARSKESELAAEVMRLAEQLAEAAEDQQADIAEAARQAGEQQQAAKEAVEAAEKHLKTVENRAAPKDIVDIIVSQPIQIRVHPQAEEQE